MGEVKLSEPDWDEVVRICGVVAKTNWRYGKLAGMEPEELANVLAADCVKAHRKNPYDPEFTLNTWVGGIAKRRIIDNVRKNDWTERKDEMVEDHAKEGYAGKELTFAKGAVTPPPNDSEVLEWIPPALNRRRGSELSAHAYFRAIAYKRNGYVDPKTNRTRYLSWQSLWVELRNNPALVRAFGFKRTPAEKSLRMAEKRLRAWAGVRRKADRVLERRAFASE